tara:strand:- start:769 stop:1725 length:957 start_codon:yes stop_codon:yes gene_type:complete
MNNLVAVTIGDIKGIGINLIIKEWKKGNIKNFVIFSNIKIINKYLNKSINKNIINKINNNIYEKYNKNKINIFDIDASNIYENCFNSLNKAYYFTNKNYFIGILTLPINKIDISKFVKKNFIDQTTFFSNKERKQNTSMMFVYKKKFYIPLTTHIELKNVYKYFKQKNKIINKILNINKTLIEDFKIKNPNIIMAGINPHSGENGLISKDDTNLITPIIDELKKNRINIHGPVSGDSIINNNNLNRYNAFIFTYHDQALIPFKILSNFSGVNYTSNLDIIRVSPSHGTARDMIKSNKKNSMGIINSIKLIKEIYKNRK